MKVFADPCFHQADVCFPGNSSGQQPGTSNRFTRALSLVSCGYHLSLTSSSLKCVAQTSENAGGTSGHMCPPGHPLCQWRTLSWAAAPSAAPPPALWPVGTQFRRGERWFRASVLQGRLFSLLIPNPRRRELIALLSCTDPALHKAPSTLMVEIKAITFPCSLFDGRC